ncbi:hypothetical protein ONE63_007520 [Megalurothrips usitatus]|uniref:Uncharacterized protein n=1 Tax=Megalurothrips usitatus TaxID=439358 RepID=A0AAV7XMZ8_9NEOP|nr:hypothetical protein ONE63_007520 [Megalurothrips usitatus]
MEASGPVTHEDVEAGVVEADARPPRSVVICVDKAVSTGDLGAALGAPLGDLLAALVQSKASAIKAECEREDERSRGGPRAGVWRLHWLHRKEPQAQSRVTPMVHHHHHHGHHHPLHHHHHHHHHHRNHHHQPPLTLLGSPAAAAEAPSPCSSDLAACTLPAPQDVTITGMCTTSDAPCLPSDSTLSPGHPDEDSDSGPNAPPPLPLDPPPSRPRPRPRVPPPLRRTLSSRSHQYHNFDYPAAPRATSLSCNATPMGTPLGTPPGTPPGTPVASAAPSRSGSPPTPAE